MLLSPMYDMRLTAAPPRERLAAPAPFPRPVLTRGDNVGILELLAARPDAMAAARDGFEPGMRTHCWRAGARAARCPLTRPGDCSGWFEDGAAGGAPPPARASSGALQCLPAVLLLGARGCGTAQLAASLGAHPDVTVVGPAAQGQGAPRPLRPWWSHGPLASFSAAIRSAVAAVAARPAQQLLLQWSTLDRDAAGLAPALWDANVSLADLLPRTPPPSGPEPWARRL